ncbi:Orotate phosphoribosyltransferase [compost metagenome]
MKEAGATPLGVLAIFSYQLDKATTAFEEAGIPLQTLSNYTALMDVAVELGYVQAEDLATLKAWREDPTSFGK